MKVVILAGGLGTRMAELFPGMPKALLMIGGKTLIEHQLDALKKNGFREFILCLGFKASLIQDYLETHPPGDCDIECRVEKTPMGTGGCLSDLRSRLRDDFIVLNGDMMLRLQFGHFIAFHRRCRSCATLIVHRVTNPEHGDLVRIGRDKRVTKIETRPHGFEADACWVNAGIVALSADVFRFIPAGKTLNLEKDILKQMVGNEAPVYAWQTRSYIRDIGTPESYRQCVEEYQKSEASGRIKARNINSKSTSC